MKSAFVLSLCLFPMGCTSPQQVTVEEIHSALSGYYGSIHSLRCEYVVTLSDGTDMRYEWLQQGDMFRFTKWKYTSDTITEVFGFNGSQGKRLTFQEDGPAQCKISSDLEQESYDWRLPIDPLGLRIRLVPDTTLASLIRPGACLIVGNEKISGAQCIHVRTLPVMANPLKPTPLVIDAYLDESHDFLPRRLDLTYGENDMAVLHRHDSLEYRKVRDTLTGDARWFPVLIYQSGGPKSIRLPITEGGTRLRVTDVQLNEVVPAETFDPSIPRGTAVIDVERNRKYVEGGQLAVTGQIRALTELAQGTFEEAFHGWCLEHFF